MSQELAHARVLVAGDIMLDRYWQGPCSRISPEAPVPIVRVKDSEYRAGGAGNVALNIAALQAQAGMVSIIGDDESGRMLNEMFRRARVETLLLKEALPTITKLRILSQHQQLLRLDFEEDMFPVDKTRMLETVKARLEHYRVLILSDYGKGVLSDPRSLIDLARAQGVRVLIDPKGADFTRYRGASLITPNMKEFELVVGPCPTDQILVDKARRLIEQQQLEALLITRSEKGMTLVTCDGRVHTLPTHAREVFDVTGAGDTVIAVMGTALASGHDMDTAMNLANAAASVVVSKIGTATVTPEELHRALNRTTDIPTGVVAETKVCQAMEKCHLQGEKVVMTNGCFDIMHAGHAAYLQAARNMGDRLIVAVNDDASVARLKGPQRPVVSLEDRMAMLSALECVDWVVPFSEDTPARLIETLLPDVLVKGADYQVEEIAGAQAVHDNGGEVRTVTLTPGCSSSGIIHTIQHLNQDNSE